MYLKYLPILAKRNAPRAPRELRRIENLAWHPLPGSLQEMCVALITSGAIREKKQPPFPHLGDASYRMVTSDPLVTDLHVDHRTRFGIHAHTDPEVAFPRLALWTLAERGIIGRVAPCHFSIYGGIREYKEIEEKLAPELASQLIREGVDLAVFLPFWPYCHETVSLVSNIVEAQGISTLIVGTVRDIMMQVRAPRVVFVNHPVGQTFGRPRAWRKHQQVLRDALLCAPLFKKRGQIIDLPYQWRDRPGSSWRKSVEREILMFKG